MSEVVISYARSTAAEATRIAAGFRALGYEVWIDTDLPAHRDYSDVIEEQVRTAKAVVVVWSADAAKSQWVRAEADVAREAGTLVQVTLDGAALPMPFNRIQCAEMGAWRGDMEAPGWRKAVASVAELVRRAPAPPPTPRDGAAPALPDKPSIALLAFANLSGDPAQDYFADGMVIEIATALARFPSLFVTASGSGLSYRDSETSRGRIAHELGVRYLLEGSVRKAGERVRIAVRLIEAAEDRQLWAERFDGVLEDVFELQDRVANAVASQIEPTIQQAEIRRASARPTEDLTAYDLYLRALPLLQRYSKETFDEGLELLDRAIARDPDYALALAYAAGFRATRAMLQWSEDAEQDVRTAFALRERALRAAPDDPDVLAQAAMAAIFAGVDRDLAEVSAERALARNPGSAFAWMGSGWVHVYGGRAAEALGEFQTALRLDPRSSWRPIILDGTSCALFSLRRFDEAIAACREAGDLLPAMRPLYVPFIASALAHLGRVAEAREMAKGASIDVLAGWLEALAPGDRELVRAGFALAQGGG